LDGLLKSVRGDSKPAASSSSSSGGSSSGGSSDSGTTTRKRGLLRRVGSAIKSGLKKAVGKTARGISNVSGAAASKLGEDAQMEIILDYLLEYDVCTLDDAEEVMMELTDEEITNILAESGEYDPMEDDDFDHDEAERTRGQSGKNKSITVKKKKMKKVDEAMSSYDRNRKRAAERAAARNAARDAGKTGAVPGVGYVTPRRERETYVDSAGITRHKSGAKMPKKD
jgi:hypothetical protein